MEVLLFKSTVKLELKKFFLVTGLLLIFVAAGLVSHSVHALGNLELSRRLLNMAMTKGSDRLLRVRALVISPR
ncbi:FTR1 family protein [Desulfosporosinus sp. BICA1-9]|uniref:FTR1 family protein n=1 Tax=Desulfosporosinus sp. BICA1-9 TaxID=1531958 RepID=UPI0034543458